MTTRGVDRLETRRSILQVDHQGYIDLAYELIPLGHDSADALYYAVNVGPFNLRHMQTVRELGLDWEDLIVMAMSCADEVQLGPLVALFPDLAAEIEDNENPLRDDDGAAADRAYSNQLDDQLGVL